MWFAVCDDILMSAVLAAAVTMLLTLALTSRLTKLQALSVFAPATSRKGSDCAHMQDTAAARVASLAYTCTTAVVLAALSLHVASWLYPTTTAAGAPVRFAIAAVYWAVFLFAKHLLTRFVNWTFFTPRAIAQWQCVHRLSVVCSAVAWTAATLLAVCNNLTVTYTALLLPVAVATPMIVTIWGAWKLFFGKMVGCLHFLLYLCTLELLLPLLAVAVLPFAIITS